MVERWRGILDVRLCPPVGVQSPGTPAGALGAEDVVENIPWSYPGLCSRASRHRPLHYTR